MIDGNLGPGEQQPKQPWASKKAEKALEWAIVFAVFDFVVIGLIWVGQKVLL